MSEIGGGDKKRGLSQIPEDGQKEGRKREGRKRGRDKDMNDERKAVE